MATKRRCIRFIRYTLSALWWCVLLLLFALLVCIIGAKLRGEVPKIFGYSVMQIVSGSMEPDIPTGSYILIKEIPPEDVAVGDVITFFSDDPRIYGYPNTHRVVEAPIMGEDGLVFVTQGDANDAHDPVPARADALIGVHVKTLSGLTRFAEWLSSGAMIPMLLILLLAGIAMMVLITVKKSRATTDDVIEQKEKAHEDEHPEAHKKA